MQKSGKGDNGGKKLRKLAIKRETIRSLSHRELGQVVGGTQTDGPGWSSYSDTKCETGRSLCK